jgi:hypothetical protein
MLLAAGLWLLAKICSPDDDCQPSAASDQKQKARGYF